jgi:hypothetical protein
MQGQVQVVKLHHAVQPGRQFVKQFPQVTVLRDGFRHLEERPVLRLRRNSRQLPGGNITHTVENSTPIHRGSTWRDVE